MTEQAEQKSEQRTNESKPLADMSLQEIQAEIERVDAEMAQAPPPRAPSESGPASGRRTPFTDARTSEEIANEIGAVRRNLVREYEGLNADETRTDEYKAEQAWKAYDRARPLIEERAKAARETLLKDAQRLEEASIPFPGGQAMKTNDLQVLSLTQGERARLVAALNYEHPSVKRLREKGKNAPDFEDSAPDKLRDAYGHGLTEGGVRGAAICRAALQLAEERQIDAGLIVDQYRSDWQRERLREGQERRLQARSVYGRVPMPSTPRPGGPRSIEEAGAGKRRSALGLVKKGTAVAKPKRRKPNWK